MVSESEPGHQRTMEDGWMTSAKSRVFLLGSGSLANHGWLALVLSLPPTITCF
jgi:hypothetical protein